MLCLSALPGWAQPLPELYQFAAQNDPALQAARAATRAALFRTGQAEALRKPTVGVKADLGVNRSVDSLAAPDRISGLSGTVGLQVQQSVFNRADAIGVDAAQAQVAAARRQEATAANDLQWRLVQAYVEVLAARAAATVQMQARATLSTQLATVQAALRAGNATAVDLHETQARLDLALTQERAAVADVRTKHAALDAVTGSRNVAPHPLALVARIATEPTGRATDWIDAARNKADSVLQSSASLDVAQWGKRRARAAYSPTVVLSAGASVGTQQQLAHLGGDIGTLRRNGNTQLTSVALTLNVPIDANAAIDQREKEALALEERARAELDASQRNAASAAEQTWLQLQSLKEQVLGTEAAERSSAQALAASERALAAGVRVRLDTLIAQTQLFAIRRDLVRLRHEATLTWLRLQYLSGSLSVEKL